MPAVSPITNNQTSNAINQAMGQSNMGKEEFLNLLVTQLRYQNPLEPMKDTEFVAQLAQFSSLEQLSNINTTLDNSSQLDYVLSQTIANTMATTLIGKEVIATGNQINHSYDSGETLHFNLAANAASAEIKIYDEKGALVRTIETNDLDSGLNSIEWNGNDESGANIAAGTYTFEVTAKNASGESVDVETRRIGIVESVRYENGQGYLVIDGQEISLSDILEINMPGQSHSRPINNG